MTKCDDLGKHYRGKAEPISEEIMHSIVYHIRYKLSCWPKEDDIKDMKRIVKSILVQHMLRKE